MAPGCTATSCYRKAVQDDKLKEDRILLVYFKTGYVYDEERADPGFWRFCLSYNSCNDADFWSLEDDAVTREVASDEMAHDKVRVHLGGAIRPWSRGTEWFEGSPGGFYDAVIHAERDWQFGYRGFLAGTVGVHGRVCLIHLDHGRRSVRVTVPSVIGVSAVADILRICKRAAENAVRPWSAPRSLTQHLDDKLETLREDPVPLRAWQEDWVEELAAPDGEFILRPWHMLSFMDSSHIGGRPGSFFAV